MSHLLAHACAAHVDIGVGGVEGYGLFEVVVGHAEVVFLQGYACEAEGCFGVAQVEALKALEVGFCFGELAGLELGVGFHGEDALRGWLEARGFLEVGEGELAASGLVVDGRAQQQGAEQMVLVLGGCTFYGAVHVVECFAVLVEVVVVVGASEQGVVVVGVGAELLGVDAEHGLRDGVVDSLALSLRVGRSYSSCGNEGCDEKFTNRLIHLCD